MIISPHHFFVAFFFPLSAVYNTDPVMTVANSTAVFFTRCGFSNVGTGTCTIQVGRRNFQFLSCPGWPGEAR